MLFALGGRRWLGTFLVVHMMLCCAVLTLAVCLQAVLYESEVINEWLEEAYPDPPMLPQQPLLRAKVGATLLYNCPWLASTFLLSP